MNQRFLLALVLTAIVIVVTPFLFSSRTPVPAVADSLNAVAQSQPDTLSTAATPTAPLQASTGLPAATQVSTAAALVGDSIRVRSPRAQYVFTNTGASPLAVSLDSYPSRRPGRHGTSAELITPGDRLVRFTLALGKDTLRLDTIPLTRRTPEVSGVVEYNGVAGSFPVRVIHTLPTKAVDDYMLRTLIEVTDAPQGSTVLVRMAEKLFSNEPDTLDDMTHLAISYRSARGEGDIESVGYSKLDTGVVRAEAGPINWVAVRNKYFLLAIRGVSSPFSGLALQGKPKINGVHAQTLTTAVLPLKEGKASLDVYSGPQDFERLQRLGGELDQANPYAGWFHGIVQPVATIVMKALLWMKRTTQLNYGWVLVLFGIAVRLLLWPLNQSAMRTSIKMQRLQPELQALQKKHSDDPRRQQEAIMKVYKDHDMSPLSPLMGCLPMLLPMPVLFALYFVFQNTIEFRGVPFLWLPDISLKDPYYITPVLMGVSMFIMSWIGLRGAPPNPQAKMMSYMMPVMLTALFLNFASGLNLYYAVQNVAALPQQWLLARERGKNPPPATVAAPVSGRKKQA